MSASPPATPPPELPAPLAGLGFAQHVIPPSPLAARSAAETLPPERDSAAAAPPELGEPEPAAAASSTSAARLAPAAEILSPPAPPPLSRFSSSYSSYSALSAGSTSAAAAAPVILGLAVVDFNHLVGPQVEFTVPEALAQDADILASLPFLALPDGSHLVRAACGAAPLRHTDAAAGSPTRTSATSTCSRPHCIRTRCSASAATAR